MRLLNVGILNAAGSTSIVINGQTIQDSNSDLTSSFDLDLGGAIAFPGLINSHDHLDFNCFTPLGDRVYNNYTDWARCIHAARKDDIDKVLAIPLPLRISWGIYKNLLAGVTTVINHGTFLQVDKSLINIYQGVQNLHSVKFQKRWKWKLNNPLARARICVIHAGEGTDRPASEEIDELIKWNLWQRKIVAVHGVAMNTVQATRFAGLVWCPESNQVLLNRHASIAALKEQVKIVFGTDSTLTGNWNIWKHLRLARHLASTTDSLLFDMVSAAPAALWGFNTGEIKAGKYADIVVAAPKHNKIDWDSFFSTNPADILLVLQKGNIRLFDKSLLPQLIRHIDITRFSQVTIGNVEKFVAGNLPLLVHSLKKHYPQINLPLDIAVK